MIKTIEFDDKIVSKDKILYFEKVDEDKIKLTLITNEVLWMDFKKEYYPASVYRDGFFSDMCKGLK